ncbi:MAG TPA: DM13 domain-containing protein [Methyloceanibacter sp.]|jgi:Electron transfer DM13|nr:DM13 domain-containing protein [Methyloceanibacter sp.]
MWRWLRVFLLGGVFGAICGLALGLFLFPFLFPPPEATEQLATGERGKLVATGKFIHASPSDPIHYGKGAVSVYDGVVFLHDDFAVGPGPKFHVYLVAEAHIRDAGQVTGSMFVDLGRLRAFKGSQNYRVPEGTDLAKFPSVVIWCEQFSVLISPADLKFEQRP